MFFLGFFLHSGVLLIKSGGAQVKTAILMSQKKSFLTPAQWGCEEKRGNFVEVDQSPRSSSRRGVRE